MIAASSSFSLSTASEKYFYYKSSSDANWMSQIYSTQRPLQILNQTSNFLQPNRLYSAYIRSQDLTNAPTSATVFNHFKAPSDFGIYRFWALEQRPADSKFLQAAYHDLTLEDAPIEGLTSNKFLVDSQNYIPGEFTVLRFRFTPTTIPVTDQLQIEFQTHNDKEPLFENDLGVSALLTTESLGSQFFDLDCYESSSFLKKDALMRVRCILEVGD